MTNMIEIKGKVLSYKSTPQGLIVTLDGDGEIVEKQETKPLLEKAKVGDRVELQSGEKKVITDVVHKPDLFAVFIGSNLYNVDGVSINYSNITRLIPAGTPEWRELEIAEARKKYPNLNTDLSKVKGGDRVLMSDGTIKIVECLWNNDNNSGFDISIGITYKEEYKPHRISCSCNSWLYNGDACSAAKNKGCTIVCLGILRDYYTTLEIFQKMERGECKQAYSKSLDVTLVWRDNGIHRIKFYRGNEYELYALESSFLAATDWEEIA